MKRFSPEKLIEFRELHKLNQAEFAATIGATRQNVWSWEKGDSIPSTTSLLKIVNRYKLPSLDCFFVDTYYRNDNSNDTENHRNLL